MELSEWTELGGFRLILGWKNWPQARLVRKPIQLWVGIGFHPLLETGFFENVNLVIQVHLPETRRSLPAKKDQFRMGNGLSG
jgi:hypothetical protein